MKMKRTLKCCLLILMISVSISIILFTNASVNAETLFSTYFYEAESYTSRSGCIFGTNSGLCTGTGILAFNESGSWAEWNNINAASSGEYTIIIKYSNASAVDLTSQLYVNNTYIQDMPFKPTSNWNIWKVDRVVVNLNQGLNTIKIVSGANGGPRIDNIAISSCALASPPSPVYDVTSYGAVGDGTTLNTAAIQNAIDACTATGGSVRLANGIFLTGQITLKSNVTLYIDKTATLLGSQNDSDYPVNNPNTSGSEVSGDIKSLIYADGAQYVTITGGGTIDGQGDKPEWMVEADGPYSIVKIRLLFLANVTNLKVTNVDLKRSGCWTFNPVQCTNVIIDGINLESTIYANRDGIDVNDCHNITITNSTVACDDDAICMKSACGIGIENVTVKNCTINKSARANGIKMGTVTYGGLKHALYEDIVILNIAGGAISMQSVDGADLYDITFNRIKMNSVGSPIHVLNGAGVRNRKPADAPPKVGSVGKLAFKDITATNARTVGCAISGTAWQGVTYYVQDIIFDNVDITFAGGYQYLPSDPVEYSGIYPSYNNFGILPAYGFYVRHTKNVVFTGCDLSVLSSDVRPAIVYHDVIPKYECESLTTTVSDAVESDFDDANCSNGSANNLAADGINDYVQYSLNVLNSGTYKIKAGVKTKSDGGKFKLYMVQDAVFAGTEQDTYTSTDGYAETDLGSYTFSTSGTKDFRFIVTGKNASSSGYQLAFDYIRLIPDTPPPAATELLGDSFDLDEAGNKPADWTLSESSGTVSIVQLSDTADKAVKLASTSTSGSVSASKGFTAASGKVVVSVYIRADETGHKCLPYIYSGGTTAISVFSDSGYLKAYNGASVADLMPISYGKYYKIAIWLDTNTDKYDVFVDGVLKASQFSFRNPVDYVDKIAFIIGNITGNLYFDNASVYVPKASVNESNFDDEMLGSNPKGWTVTETGGTAHTYWEIGNTLEENYGVVKDKAVKIDTASTSCNVGIAKNLVPTSGVLVIKASIRTDQTGWKDALHVYGDSDVMAVKIGFDGGYLKAYNADTLVNLGPIDYGSYYAVSVWINTNTGKYDAYVNGALKASQLSFSNQVASVNKIYMGIQNVIGDLYIDKVSAYIPNVYSESIFDTDTTGDNPSGWTIDEAGGAVDVVETPGSTDKSLRLNSISDAGNATASKTFTNTSAVTYVEAYVRVDDNNLKYVPKIYGDSGTLAVSLFAQNGHLYGYTKDNDGNLIARDIMQMTLGQSYLIQIYLKPDADSYDLYVDGDLKEVSLKFVTPISVLNKVYFGMENTTGTFYVDKVRVYSSEYARSFVDDETIGNVPSACSVTQTGGTVSVIGTPSSSDKSIKINAVSDTSDVAASYTFTPVKGTVTVEATVGADETGHKCAPYVFSGTTMAVSVFLNNGYIKAYDGASTIVDIMPISYGKFYDIKLVMDTYSDTYDLYVNGILEAADLSFRTAVTSLDKVRFSIGGVAGNLYFDKVKVYSESLLR